MSLFLGTCQFPTCPIRLSSFLVAATEVVDESALEVENGNKMAKSKTPFVGAETIFLRYLFETEILFWGWYLHPKQVL